MGPLNWKWKKGNPLKKTQKNINFDTQGSYFNKCRVPENRSIAGDEWDSAETARRFLVPVALQ